MANWASTSYTRVRDKKSLVKVFNDTQEITFDNLPIEISAVSPEGADQMKKLFVKINRNKSHMFFERVIKLFKRYLRK